MSCQMAYLHYVDEDWSLFFFPAGIFEIPAMITVFKEQTEQVMHHVKKDK